MYTRVYSKRSAGQLSSGKRPRGNPLTISQRRMEFRNHSQKSSRKPTALVSVSDRIIDTVRRAWAKHYNDGESPADIWIAFIKVPTIPHRPPVQTHDAEILAKECGISNPEFFRHETVFEWAVPDDFVLHKICLHTLIDRGFSWEKYFAGPIQDLRPPPTSELRDYIGEEFEFSDPWDIGISMACFARHFGARAPVDWIAHQLYYDCARPTILDNLDDAVRIRYGLTSTIVGFDFFHQLDLGIEEGLYDMWLGGTDFLERYKQFEEWQEVMEDVIIHDQIGFWEDWHGTGCPDRTQERSGNPYKTAKGKLAAKHEAIRADIEAQAVRIGL